MTAPDYLFLGLGWTVVGFVAFRSSKRRTMTFFGWRKGGSAEILQGVAGVIAMAYGVLFLLLYLTHVLGLT